MQTMRNPEWNIGCPHYHFSPCYTKSGVLTGSEATLVWRERAFHRVESFLKFMPAFKWMLGTELRSQAYAASTLTQWVIFQFSSQFANIRYFIWYFLCLVRLFSMMTFSSISLQVIAFHYLWLCNIPLCFFSFFT